jgi:hypothetical protein
MITRTDLFCHTRANAIRELDAAAVISVLCLGLQDQEEETFSRIALLRLFFCAMHERISVEGANSY